MLFSPARSLYVHIPFCASKCDYCDFFSVPVACSSSTETAKIMATYVERLLADLETQAQCGIFAPLDTIYVGGGTPSLLAPSDLTHLIEGIQGLVPLTENAEVTIEANPEGITAPWLAAVDAAGVNRISLGVQSLKDASLAAVHRGANSVCALTALALLRDHWRGTLSVDLIAGLPAETEASFRLGLDRVLSFRPHHISLYALAIEPGTPLYNRVADEENTNHEPHKPHKPHTPTRINYSDDIRDELWLLGRDLLEAEGYAQYEVSNFARPGFECRHNQAYWESRSWAALGAAASGTLYRDDGSALRYTATKDPANYR
jgi:oxygen-independent coproporphyrinogen-3 oxidase